MCYSLRAAQISNQLNSWRPRASVQSSLEVPSAEPGSCEDFLVGRPACRDGFMGKAVVCVFHLEGCAEGGTNQASRCGFSRGIPPESQPQPWLWLLDVHLTQALAFAARISEGTQPAPRADSAHTSGRGGQGRRRRWGQGVGPLSGGTRSITLKVKGSKVPASPLEGRERAPRGLLHSAARGFPAAARRRGEPGRPSREPLPGTRSASRAAGPGAGSREAAALWLAWRSASPSAPTGSRPASPERALFPFSASGKGLYAGAGAVELPATCPARRGGGSGGASKLSRRRALRIPQESPSPKHHNLPQRHGCVPPLWPSILSPPHYPPGPHLRPGQGPSPRFAPPLSPPHPSS